MKSYIIIAKTLPKHMIIVILQFWVKMWFLNKTSFISQNHWSFTEKNVLGREYNLWNLSLIRSFSWILYIFKVSNTKQERMSGAKLFWGVYNVIFDSTAVTGTLNKVFKFKQKVVNFCIVDLGLELPTVVLSYFIYCSVYIYPLSHKLNKL